MGDSLFVCALIEGLMKLLSIMNTLVAEIVAYVWSH